MSSMGLLINEIAIITMIAPAKAAVLFSPIKLPTVDIKPIRPTITIKIHFTVLVILGAILNPVSIKPTPLNAPLTDHEIQSGRNI